uniref:Doublecortin domain-containing protein n=1 Tax=Strongyloides venezuelensis TaxID=75913 RepID=A0A0K0G348_STRVS
MDTENNQVEKLQRLNDGLQLLKLNKKILNYECQRSSTKENGESINLVIEFEISDDVSISSSILSSISIISYSSTDASKACKNKSIKGYDSSTTASAKASMTSTDNSLCTSTGCKDIKMFDSTAKSSSKSPKGQRKKTFIITTVKEDKDTTVCDSTAKSSSKSPKKQRKKTFIITKVKEDKDTTVYGSTATSSSGSSTGPVKSSSSTSKHFKIESSQINDSTSTSLTESSLASTSQFSSSATKYDIRNCRTNLNLKMAKAVPALQQDKFIDIRVFIRKYNSTKEDDGNIQRIDIEINFTKATLSQLVKTVLPTKDPMEIMMNGIYFIRNNFNPEVDFDKEINWLSCYPSELNVTIDKIYGTTTKKDVKMSFVFDDISKM